MAFVVAVDGFGPADGWLTFGAVMVAVILGGAVLGLAGRKVDRRDRDSEPGR